MMMKVEEEEAEEVRAYKPWQTTSFEAQQCGSGQGLGLRAWERCERWARCLRDPNNALHHVDQGRLNTTRPLYGNNLKTKSFQVSFTKSIHTKII